MSQPVNVCAGKVCNVPNVEYVHHYLLEWPFWRWCHGDGFSWLVMVVQIEQFALKFRIDAFIPG